MLEILLDTLQPTSRTLQSLTLPLRYGHRATPFPSEQVRMKLFIVADHRVGILPLALVTIPLPLHVLTRYRSLEAE